MLDGQSIIDMLPGVNVIQYQMLNGIRDIRTLIPRQGLVILYPGNSNSSGHWTCLFIRNKKIFFFDSYGNFPDEALTYDQGNLDTQERGRLNQLLHDSPLDVDFNNYQLQSADPSVSTCGYWCVARLMNKHLDADEFYECWKIKEGGVLPDILVEEYVKMCFE